MHFKSGQWEQSIDVQNFIKTNYTPYLGDEHFLCGPTERTQAIWTVLQERLKEEQDRGGVWDVDTETVSSLLTFPKGVIEGQTEIIYGLQTDEALKRAINPFGGIRMARQACEAYGYKLSEGIEKNFEYKTTHNDGVFRVYSETIRDLRRSGVITGLPDAYGRGRIIGDYRRIALYGVNRLIAEKQNDKVELEKSVFVEESIRLSEELYRQIDFLKQIIQMAKAYGHDISQPAQDTKEAIQWTYYGYLAAIKEQNGAAMSLGRISSFLDIYAERDLAEGRYNESEIQEMVDDFIIKLRLARELRTPDYNELFAGDPMWITEVIGGMGQDGRTMVTKMSYRFLHTLYNLGPAPEPNLTILWSQDLPDSFKRYCAKVSIDTDAIQYENDDLMRPIYGDDYGIACCVSAMKIGKEMQFFGARSNLPKTLLLALNGGFDEYTQKQIAPKMPVMTGKLDFDTVWERFEIYLDWMSREYVSAMNIIHYMHDKYAYEKIQMALHDTTVHRFMAFGVAGLSVIADSLSAIKHAKVMPLLDSKGHIEDFRIVGDFPKFGNDDDRVDSIAVKITDTFIAKLRQYPTYRNAEHTLSILTITSNVVYGKKTGATPDGRHKGQPFAPGANPMHGRDTNGALASLNSVAKIPFESCRDGVSYTFSVTPQTLGQDKEGILKQVVDGYFSQSAHHININVLNQSKLIEAMNDPSKYPNLTIRVSGYAVNFNRLSRQQQEEVIARTYHESL